GASYLQRDGFTVAAKRLGNVEKDGLRDANFSGRFGWTPAENFDVDAIFRYVDQDADIDNDDFVFGPIDNPIRQMRTNAFFTRAQTRLALLDGLWDHRVGFNLTDYVRRDTDPGIFFDPQFLGQSRMLDYQTSFLLGRDHTLTAGYDFLQEDSGRFSLSEWSQTLKGIYVEDRVRLLGRWVASAGFRWIDHSSAGSASTYQFTTRYRLNDSGTAFHGSIGTGFRAPALEELFNSFAGNPDLEPETSFGWDCGLEQSFCDGRLVVDGTYFRNDITNLIQFDFLTFTLENVGRAFTSGVEALGRWQVDDSTTLSANYVYTFTEDLDAGLPLFRRPRHKAFFNVNRRFWCDRANVYLSLQYVGPRRDSRGELPEYYLLNLAGAYDLTDGCQWFARIDNVLNESYEEVWGYQTAGISGFSGLRFYW
ncbi:MAG: TonB-dependent receptor plug domain-containing protein, partial [Planctomycetota bacterium]